MILLHERIITFLLDKLVNSFSFSNKESKNFLIHYSDFKSSYNKSKIVMTDYMMYRLQKLKI